MVIDVNPASLERARADGHLIIEADATDDATLRAAGIERARGLISTIDSDAQNVYVILSARALTGISSSSGGRAHPSAEEKLGLAGADRIVSPYTMAGRRLAELAIRPRVVDFLTSPSRTASWRSAWRSCTSRPAAAWTARRSRGCVPGACSSSRS